MTNRKHSADAHQRPKLELKFFETSHDDGFRLVAYYRNIDGDDRAALFDRDLINDPRKIHGLLLRLGADIGQWQDNRRTFGHLIGRRSRAHFNITSRTGWSEDQYLSIRQSFGGDIPLVHECQFAVNATSPIDGRGSRSKVKYSRRVFRKFMSALACGCSASEYLTFSASLGYAGPLLAMLNMPGCAFVLVGESATGKSHCLRLTASIRFGTERLGQAGDTGRRHEEEFSAANDATYVADELTGNAAMARVLAFMSEGGKGRNRSKSAMVQSHFNDLSWRCFLMSASEQTLDQSPTRLVMDGERRRMLEYPVPSRQSGGIFSSWGNDLTSEQRRDVLAKVGSAGGSHDGYTFDRFVKRLAWNRPKKLDEHVNWVETWLVKRAICGEVDQLQQMAARYFAVVAVAGEYAVNWGLLPIAKGEARKAALGMFRRHVQHRIGLLSAQNGSEEVARALSDRDRFPWRWEIEADKIAAKQVRGFIQKRADGYFLHVQKDALQEVFPKNTLKVIENLDERGLLRTVSQSRYPQVAVAGYPGCEVRNEVRAKRRFLCIKVGEDDLIKSGRLGSQNPKNKRPS